MVFVIKVADLSGGLDCTFCLLVVGSKLMLGGVCLWSLSLTGYNLASGDHLEYLYLRYTILVWIDNLSTPQASNAFLNACSDYSLVILITREDSVINIVKKYLFSFQVWNGCETVIDLMKHEYNCM